MVLWLAPQPLVLASKSDIRGKMLAAAGLRFTISTDAHATDQLDWQAYGTDRAADCGVQIEQVVNAMSADDLLAWSNSRS